MSPIFVQDADLPVRLDLRLLDQTQRVGQGAAGLFDLRHLSVEIGQLQELVERLVDAGLLSQQVDEPRARRVMSTGAKDRMRR